MQADHDQFFQNKRDWKSGDQTIETTATQKRKNSKGKDNHTKCYLCKRKGHTIKSCIFELEFRKHEDYC
jgi:hypothetical protein